MRTALAAFRWYTWKLWNLRYWNLRRKNNRRIEARLRAEYAALGVDYDREIRGR